MTVYLITVPQAGLNHPVATVDLVDQPVHVWDEVVVHFRHVPGDDGAKQQPTEPRRRVDRQYEAAEGESARRRARSCVPHL